jgi:hypothetical protein
MIRIAFVQLDTIDIQAKSYVQVESLLNHQSIEFGKLEAGVSQLLNPYQETLMFFSNVHNYSLML